MMVKYILVLFLFLLYGCVFHRDELEYYVDGYSPNNDLLATDGYYYTQSDSLFLTDWPDAIYVLYFLKDGTFYEDSNSENLDTVDRWICESKEKMFTHGPYGFYTMKSDTILVEYLITTNFVGVLSATRFDFKAIKNDSGFTIVENNGVPCKYDWLFHQNSCVPDSIKNWITRHRKYRINSN